MSGIHPLRQQDLRLVFQDCGEAARFEEIAQQYDVTTGRVDEARYVSNLCVVRTAGQIQQHPHVSATLSLSRQAFLVRCCDLPERAPMSSARLTLPEGTYEICSVQESNRSGVVVLDCIRAAETAESGHSVVI